MGLVYIASVTASASATVEFTTGIDATYNEYQFHCVNLHPATNNVYLLFQVNAVGQSGFNETITSTYFYAYHFENDSGAGLSYDASHDQAQGTADQRLSAVVAGTNSDESISGVLTLYAPSSTTYVKHFTWKASSIHGAAAGSYAPSVAGYINTTAAIDEVRFKFHFGNIDEGSIHMYGVG